jgi:GntR family transcriptional repressor for pyruvate dehydrogenase complex
MSSFAQPARLDRQSLSDRLADLLARQIESGDLEPGDRLPTEAQLSATHGVSRGVVREAVHRVKSRGLLLSRQGSGVFVAQPAEHQPLQFDPAVLGSVDALVQVMEVRRVLEAEIAALAATRATRAQVAAIKRALAAIDTAVAAGEDGVAEDMALHRSIGVATGNPQFSQMLGFLEQYLRQNMRITRGIEARRADFFEAVRKEHRSIVDAIAARDPAAARRAALRHLAQGARRLQITGLLPAAPTATASRSKA